MSEVTRFKKGNTEKQLSNSEIKEHLLETLVEFGCREAGGLGVEG